MTLSPPLTGKRGRPSGRTTPLRAKVAAAVHNRRNQGRPVIRAAIAREVGVHAAADVARIMRDCARLGLI
jgi:hypothetical protein